MKKALIALGFSLSVMFGYALPAMALSPLPQVMGADLTVPGSLAIMDSEDSGISAVMFTIVNNGNLRTKSFRTKISYHLYADEDDEEGEGRVVSIERTTGAGLRPGRASKLRINPASSRVSLDEVEWIEVMVDSRKAVFESDEKNNRRTFYLENQDEDGMVPSQEGGFMPDDEMGKPEPMPVEKKKEEVKKTTEVVKEVVKAKDVEMPTLKESDILWRNVKQYSGAVYLSSIYPIRAAVGTPVTLRGSGFLREGNAVNFGGGYIINLPSPDLQTITFTVPEDRVPLCAMTSPQCMLPAPYSPVTLGDYKVSVINPNGWSSPVYFSVISKDEQKEDPYKAVFNDAPCTSLGSLLMGCHKMPENDAVRFDSTMSKYAYVGTRAVLLCSSVPVMGCARTDIKYHITATTTPPTNTTITTSTSTTSTTPTTTTTTNPTTTTTTTTTTTNTATATAAALAYRGGLYYKDAWNSCMTRLGSTGANTRIKEYLNAGQFPPPWGVFTGSDASNIATCEREAGWTGYDSGNYTSNSNWVNHTWTFKDGSTQFSSILNRTDSEYTSFITTVDTETRGGYFGGWKPGGGDQSNWREFGIPVVSPTAGTYTNNYSGSGSGGYSSTSGCSSVLMGLLGTGCHSMGNAYFNSNMDQYIVPGSNDVVKSCSSEPIANCSGSGSTSTGSSNTTSGTSTYTSCPSGQYWNGSSCVNNTTSGSGSTSYTSCGTGYYWNGTSCVSNGSTGSYSGSSCTSGQYWNGSACVTGSYSTDPATGCSQAGGTWNSTSNYCQMPGSTSGSTGGSYSSDPATACGQGGGTWNGTTCQMPGQTTSRAPSRSQLANISSVIEQIKAMLRQLR